MAYLLASLVLVVVSGPFEERWRESDLLEALRLTLVMIAALLAVGGRRRTLALALVLVVPALVAKWVHHFQPHLVSPPVFLVPGLLMILFVLAHLLRFILVARRVDAEVLCAGVAGYLVLAWLWTLAYILVARLDPGAFVLTAGPVPSHEMKAFSAPYFSFITLCTVGYGDIVPVSDIARMLAMMEAMAGTFYLAILISRLVALYSSNQLSSEESCPPDGK
jgi:hypothetical protein